MLCLLSQVEGTKRFSEPKVGWTTVRPEQLDVAEASLFLLQERHGLPTSKQLK
jgi:hypothetical protein